MFKFAKIVMNLLILDLGDSMHEELPDAPKKTDFKEKNTHMPKFDF